MNLNITREDALALLKKYNKEEFHLTHSTTVEGVMRYFARELGYGGDEEFWGIVGLLHDVDFECFPEEHCIKAPALLAEIDASDDIVHAVVSHGYGLCADVVPEHEMEKILFATDELTGLIGACALMRPSKSVQDMEVSSVKKKFKDKKFAAGCSRDVIIQGAEMLGWETDHLMNQTFNLGIAFSGGVDSTFLLAFASRLQSVNFKVTALTVNSTNFAPDEIDYAKEFCVGHGIDHIIIDVDFSHIDGFKENSRERCYYCKRSIFSYVKKLAGTHGITAIADGTNLDDDSDFRPGKKALLELGIISPLKEAGLTKDEIRHALKDMGISIWNKPAFACLASRVPYGEEITEEKLNSIYKVEKAIRDMGFSQVRVRHHGEIARIELLPEDIPAFAVPATMEKINQIALDAGFSYAALDLSGYKMGNMNTSPL